jgi:hypothetical protein
VAPTTQAEAWYLASRTAVANLPASSIVRQIECTLVQQEVSPGHDLTWVQVGQTSYRVVLAVDDGSQVLGASKASSRQRSGHVILAGDSDCS